MRFSGGCVFGVFGVTGYWAPWGQGLAVVGWLPLVGVFLCDGP
jgi:hypothetical protein